MTAVALSSGPHTHSRFTISRVMVAVMACLAPATIVGFLHFGLPAVLLFLVTIAASLAFEIVCLAIAGRPVLRFATDGSAILTGWLLAMTLPPWAPWWVGVIGAGIAIVIGKHVFGGLGQNLFNPAMVARAMLLVALPVQMTVWVAPMEPNSGPGIAEALAITFGNGAPAIDAMSSASLLGHVQSGLDAGLALSSLVAPDTLDTQLWGGVAGSLGETSALALLGGGLCLVLMRIITLTIPLTVLGSLFGCAAVAWAIDPDAHLPPLLHVASGSAMLCAFFIATDYVTAPLTGLGKALYGIGTGVLIFVIRTWGAFPEGVAFAVLLMNACTPVIDAYIRPRIFGRTRKGAPLEIGGRP
ncbi:MAG: RnfABCDGE type electron transport complex subunit D [Pseudomonadota bacterium]